MKTYTKKKRKEIKKKRFAQSFTSDVNWNNDCKTNNVFDRYRLQNWFLLLSFFFHFGLVFILLSAILRRNFLFFCFASTLFLNEFESIALEWFLLISQVDRMNFNRVYLIVWAGAFAVDYCWSFMLDFLFLIVVFLSNLDNMNRDALETYIYAKTSSPF